MIPVCASLVHLVMSMDIRFDPSGYEYREIVGKCTVRGDTTLHNTLGTIHFICSILEQAMEMKTGRLVAQLIVYVGNDAVTLGEVQWWQWPLSIDTLHRTFGLISRVGIDPSDVPIVSNRGCTGYEAVEGQSEYPVEEIGQRERHCCARIMTRAPLTTNLRGGGKKDMIDKISALDRNRHFRPFVGLQNATSRAK